MNGFLDISFISEIIKISEFFILIFFIYTFGSIAILGYRKKIPFTISVLIKFALGFVCWILGYSLSILIPFKFLGADKIFGGLISALVFAISFYLFSYKVKREPSLEEINNKLRKIEESLERIRVSLLQHKIIPKPEKQEEAEKKAKELFKDYKIISSNLIEGNWEIKLAKKGKEILVVLDSYTNKVKSIVKQEPPLKKFFTQKTNIIGVSLILILIIFSLLNFQGISFEYSLFSNLGMNEMNMNEPNLSDNPECITAKNVLQYINIINISGQQLENPSPQLLSALEKTNVGYNSLGIIKTNVQGKEYGLALLIPEGAQFSSAADLLKAKFCSVYLDEVCDCRTAVSLSDILIQKVQ